MSLEIGLLSDVGRRRTGNEDALDLVELPEGRGALCVVADGMGGHRAGEVASRLAVETIRRSFEPEGGAEALVKAIREANRTVFAEADSDPEKQGMGTTVVCALLVGGQAQLANVGDSPAFLVRNDETQRLTRDHTWVAEEIARGAIRPEEASGHPYRHILTRCLGMGDEVEVDLYDPLPLRAGDVLVLCSDGLSEHVDADELPSVVSNRPAQDAAEALVELANRRGGSDNISVVVARIG
jgi:protein phosphatase